MSTREVFARNAHGKENAESMRRVLRSQGIEAYYPNYAQAPWHVKFEVNGHTFEAWPHRYKFCRTGKKAFTGYNSLMDSIKWARANKAEEIQVLEDTK